MSKLMEINFGRYTAAVVFLVCGVFLAEINADDDIRSTAAPHFIVEPETITVGPSENVTLRCEAGPVDLVDIWWLLDGIAVTSRRGVRARGRLLHVVNPQWRDGLLPTKPLHGGGTGWYQCVANNSVGAIVSKKARIIRASMELGAEALPDREIIVEEGNTALVPCAIQSSIPPASTEFEFNRNKLRLTARHLILPSGNLQIRSVSSVDSGIYRCLSTNPITRRRVTSANRVHLKVIKSSQAISPRFTWTPQTNVEVIQGESLTLECVAEGWPVPTIEWVRNDGRPMDHRFTRRLGNLGIENVEKSDRGTYICRAESSVGPPQAIAASVEVLEPPQFVVRPADHNTTEGMSVYLNCRVSGSPTPTVTWLHNTRIISVNEFISINESTLLISSVSQRDAGMYQCVAVNRVRMDYASAKLIVQRTAVMTDFDADHEMQHFAPRGSPAKLIKSPVDESTKERSVRRGDSPITKTNRGRGDNRKSSQVVRTQESWQDRAESDMRDADLPSKGSGGKNSPSRFGGREGGQRPVVKDGRMREQSDRYNTKAKLVPPPRPMISKASDTSVLLGWTLPPNDGLQITLLKVQYKQVGRSRRKSSDWQTIEEDLPESTRAFKVPGLKTGNTYRFRLVAVYSNKDNRHGPNSAKLKLGSSAEPLRVPLTAPEIVEVQPLSTSSISVVWRYNPTGRGGSKPKGFNVLYRPYSESASDTDYRKHAVIGGGSRQVNLTGLAEDTTYSIRMQAYGSDGTVSEFSNTAAKKTLGLIISSIDDEVTIKSLDNRQLHQKQSGYLVSGSSTGKAPNLFDSSLAPNRTNQRQSNEILYILLGVILGAVALVLAIVLSVCIYKHRQQQRLLTAHSMAMKNDSLMRIPLGNSSWSTGYRSVADILCQSGGSAWAANGNGYPVEVVDGMAGNTQNGYCTRLGCDQAMPPLQSDLCGALQPLNTKSGGRGSCQVHDDIRPDTNDGPSLRNGLCCNGITKKSEQDSSLTLLPSWKPTNGTLQRQRCQPSDDSDGYQQIPAAIRSSSTAHKHGLNNQQSRERLSVTQLGSFSSSRNSGLGARLSFNHLDATVVSGDPTSSDQCELSRKVSGPRCYHLPIRLEEQHRDISS